MSLIINSSRNTEFEILVAAAGPGCPSIPGAGFGWAAGSGGRDQFPHPCRMLVGPHPEHGCLGMGFGGHPKMTREHPRPAGPASGCLQNQCPKYLFPFYTLYISALSSGRDGALEAEAPVWNKSWPLQCAQVKLVTFQVLQRKLIFPKLCKFLA